MKLGQPRMVDRGLYLLFFLRLPRGHRFQGVSVSDAAEEPTLRHVGVALIAVYVDVPAGPPEIKNALGCTGEFHGESSLEI